MITTYASNNIRLEAKLEEGDLVWYLFTNRGLKPLIEFSKKALEFVKSCLTGEIFHISAKRYINNLIANNKLTREEQWNIVPCEASIRTEADVYLLEGYSPVNAVDPFAAIKKMYLTTRGAAHEQNSTEFAFA